MISFVAKTDLVKAIFALIVIPLRHSPSAQLLMAASLFQRCEGMVSLIKLALKIKILIQKAGAPTPKGLGPKISIAMEQKPDPGHQA